MSNIQYYFCVLAIYAITVFTAFPAFAADDGMDDGMHVDNKIQGLWAAPDCRTPEELHFYSEFFQIKTGHGKAIEMTPIHTLLKQKEYTVITINDKQIPTRVLEDGVLQVVDIEDGTNFSKHWDDLPIIRYHEYMHCLDTDLPKKLEKFMGISTKLDHVYPYCQYSLSEKCSEKLFASYMPADGDTLSHKDIVQILKDISIVASIGASGASLPSDLDAIAAALLNVMDTDQSNDLSLQELQATPHLWSHPAFSGPVKHKLQKLLTAINSYFPSLTIDEKDTATF